MPRGAEARANKALQERHLSTRRYASWSYGATRSCRRAHSATIFIRAAGTTKQCTCASSFVGVGLLNQLSGHMLHKQLVAISSQGR